MQASHPVELESFQRRIRHISGIQLRNIKPPQIQTPCKYLAFFTISTDRELYRSEVARCCKNACWGAVNIRRRTDRAHLRGHVATIEVWIKPFTSASCYDVDPTQPDDYEGFTLLNHYKVDLFSLIFLGKTLGENGPYLQHDNDLLISLHGVWFSIHPRTTKDVGEKSLASNYLRVKAVNMQPMYTESSLSRLVSLYSALQQEKTDITCPEQCSITLSDNRARLERAQSRLAFLKEKLKRYQQDNARIQEDIEAQQASIASKRKLVLQRFSDLDQHILDLNQRKEAFAEREQQLKQVSLARDMRQAVLVLELYSVYHVKPITENLCSIMGIELPNGTYSDRDDEALSTALGYVAHLVLMISKYLQLPLRYPLRLLGSRSCIIDDISYDRQERQRRFPLHSRVKDRSMFEHGVFLLNKDVQQLLEHHGLGVRDPLATLPNVRRLMLLLYDFTREHAASDAAEV
eukprot:m.81628 g.81628  ORF g.81628 m.81628 type:complete len:462 (-) comp14255_c1_seq6:166-1551(-)